MSVVDKLLIVILILLQLWIIMWQVH